MKELDTKNILDILISENKMLSDHCNSETCQPSDAVINVGVSTEEQAMRSTRYLPSHVTNVVAQRLLISKPSVQVGFRIWCIPA